MGAIVSREGEHTVLVLLNLRGRSVSTRSVVDWESLPAPDIQLDLRLAYWNGQFVNGMAV